jgi:hypothetical protein
MYIIPVLGRLWQEDLEFDTSLGYMVRPCLKRRKKTKNKTNKPKEKNLNLGESNGNSNVTK